MYSPFCFDKKEKGLAVKIALQKKNCIIVQKKLSVALVKIIVNLCKKNKGPRAEVIKNKQNTCLSMLVGGIFNLR